VAAYPEEETEARGWYFYISDLVVGAQQRAHGIGSKLLRVMEHVARSRNFKTLGIGVLAGSDRVHALYHRLGFQDYAMTLRKHL
jgi:ribosomal protein S18 acetylase RimI-like enzyme